VLLRRLAALHRAQGLRRRAVGRHRIPFKDVEQIAPAANETIYSLAAGIWTNDLTKAHRLIPQLRAGTVWVNLQHLRRRAAVRAASSPAGVARWAKR
jgi:aldehyde dehydrogenase (NAD+)